MRGGASAYLGGPGKRPPLEVKRGGVGGNPHLNFDFDLFGQRFILGGHERAWYYLSRAANGFRSRVCRIGTNYH